MPRLKVNTTEAQSREALPDDTYTCRVLEITGPHKGTKSSYVTIIFEVAEGEFEKRQIWDNRPVTGKGAGMFVEFWEKATGEVLPIGPEGVDLDVDTDDAVGQMLGVVTVQEEYPEGSGTFQHKVKKLVAV